MFYTRIHGSSAIVESTSCPAPKIIESLYGRHHEILLRIRRESSCTLVTTDITRKRWRRDKNEEYYAYAGEHHAIVTTAIVYSMNDIDASRRTQFQPIVSCDFEGKLCIFQPLQA